MPRDRKTPVLSIGYRGPFVPPRRNNKPVVSILADGTIGADELQNLLRFVIAKRKLLEFKRKAVEAKARGDIYITDQADTIVKIAIRGRNHRVVYNASTWRTLLERLGDDRVGHLEIVGKLRTFDPRLFRRIHQRARVRVHQCFRRADLKPPRPQQIS